MSIARLLRRLVLLLAVPAGLVGCSAAAVAAGPRAWIDFPRDGASGPPGVAVAVICHASAPNGVAGVLFSVNGTPYARSPLEEPGAAFGKVTFEWLPEAPGIYTLQARAYDKAGAASSPDTITVKISGATPVGPTGTPPAGVSPTVPPVEPTLTPTGMPSITPTPESSITPTPVKPTHTPTPVKPTLTPTTATVTPSPIPPALVKFVTDRGSVVVGECALLQWWVQNATAVFLNGEGVAGEATRSVCPDTTTTYTLHVEAPSGDVDEQITITVTAPPDTTPPPVPAPQVPADGLMLGCRAKQTLAWLPVSDASGIAGYDVRLERMAKKGVWDLAQEWVQVTDKQVTASVQCGLYYRWQVRAKDGAGNYSAWSPMSQFSVALP